MMTFQWDRDNIDFAAWDLDEELFKWHWDKLDLLSESCKTLERVNESIDILLTYSSRWDIHPSELPRIDGVGTMEELLHDKVELLKLIIKLRDSLPVLQNTD